MGNRDGGLRLGIDVGSTTVKIVVVDQSDRIVYSVYRRHYARQMEITAELLKELADSYSGEQIFYGAVCGSGGKPVAEALGVPFVQEVVANAAAVQRKYKIVRTAVELGGQDAKVIFFRKEDSSGKTIAHDMRMNGSCAGGTGAFLDEIAVLLKVRTEDLNLLAEKGTIVYDISGRCGVFAKTDIQPLLLQGARKEDIALSVFHAIAKQTIGGLAQGLPMDAPIIFEGGPLTFQPMLRQVFLERLELSPKDAVIPERPEMIVGFGTALLADRMGKNEGVRLHRWQERLQEELEHRKQKMKQESHRTFFKNETEKQDFLARHRAELGKIKRVTDGARIMNVYIGIDSGSTTSKIVLIDEEEDVIECFYRNNDGRPVDVVKDGLMSICKKYREKGIRLCVQGMGTTGYGETLMAEAFGADVHMVETIAHAQGCKKYIPDVSFVLDIGGQDMKAIRICDGIITNIMLNEACSSGCGSFLENFAGTLDVKVEDIEKAAFASSAPAELGSRCTVFMNSQVITAQREGKTREDILAGLCRSVIENVFTKVVRVGDTGELGKRVVVQGGTFRNIAVLRAIEEYLGKEVTLAPYPGEMGAVGAALLAKQNRSRNSKFIGFDEVEKLSYQTQTGVPCHGCANRCMRTIVKFSTGSSHVTGNRCERGAKVTLENGQGQKKGSNLFRYREQLLFAKEEFSSVREKQESVIGIPRVLEFWDSIPFWRVFFETLGYTVVFSDRSNRKDYDAGISYVASDTICFPAKLVHGHILSLEKKGVDRIFFPHIMHMPPEGVDKLSPYVCSVVMGYPMVVKHMQEMDRNAEVIYDTPVFHWFSEKNRRTQIIRYAKETLGATEKEARIAFKRAEQNLVLFREKLTIAGQEVIKEIEHKNSFAVVLAGRPYHSDPFVNHGIAEFFSERGISVIPVDALPGIHQEDLQNTRAEITNNFHTRMLEAAMVAAKTDCLEYVQIVSFGCGHDAILSDEIIRIMGEVGNKVPLILKLDESDASGALNIRVRSFVESVRLRRQTMKYQGTIRELQSAYPIKFYKQDKKRRTILIPNISETVTVLLSALLEKGGFLVKKVAVGDIRQIRTGKKYSHNDICFPCQMVIGELIDELERGEYAQDEVAVGMVKFQCDCRMSHYAALLRKALDSAGFTEVPVITTDFNDSKHSQPGVNLLGIRTVYDAVWVFQMMDVLTELVRKIRPYEIHHGETERIYDECISTLAEGIKSGVHEAKKVFRLCIKRLSGIAYDRTLLKPQVFVTGELLVTYHPGSNFHIEKYLEKNGQEVIFPRVTDQLRKDFLASLYEIKDFGADMFPYPYFVDKLFDHVQEKVEEMAEEHPLYERGLRPRDIYKGVEHIIPITLSCGEGWLMAAEIVHYAKKGVRSFIILQPFGCLPNHICGRGVVKKIKEEFPSIQILPLDLEPDTSYANVENRLQMLLMNQ